MLLLVACNNYSQSYLITFKKLLRKENHFMGWTPIRKTLTECSLSVSSAILEHSPNKDINQMVYARCKSSLWHVYYVLRCNDNLEWKNGKWLWCKKMFFEEWREKEATQKERSLNSCCRLDFSNSEWRWLLFGELGKLSPPSSINPDLHRFFTSLSFLHLQCIQNRNEWSKAVGDTSFHWRKFHILTLSEAAK